MSDLYIGNSTLNNFDGYSIFFDDERGPRQFAQRNERRPFFSTYEEAELALQVLLYERSREEQAVPFTLGEAEFYIRTQNWANLPGYFKDAPRDLLNKHMIMTHDNQLMFERLVATVRQLGSSYKRTYYLVVGEFFIWFKEFHKEMAVDHIYRTYTDYLECDEGVYRYSFDKVQANRAKHSILVATQVQSKAIDPEKNDVNPDKFIIQNLTGRGISREEIVRRVNEDCNVDIDSLDIYVKSCEGKAYYVVNGNVFGSVDLY